MLTAMFDVHARCDGFYLNVVPDRTYVGLGV